MFFRKRIIFVHYCPVGFFFALQDMTDIQEMTDALIEFRDQRDWEQFHNAKDLALALNIEAAELLELYLWKSPEQANPEKLREELADVIGYALLLAEKLGLDVKEIVMEKIRKNGIKYPVDKSKGNARKYNEL